MAYLRSFRRIPFPLLSLSNPTQKKVNRIVGIAVLVFATLPCFAQDQPQPTEPASPGSTQNNTQSTSVTIPAGTRLALVLTQPVQTRYIHRGDDIYAQVTSPVNSDNEVVIPPGTFVQGTVDKIQRTGGRGELRLQSMSITFPDGYVTPISGPIVLETTDGYAIKIRAPSAPPGRSCFPSRVLAWER